MKKIRTLLIFLLFLAAPVSASSEEAVIERFKVVTSPEFEVSFEVKNAFSANIVEAIKSGVPTSFTFIIEVNRMRRAWFDKGVGRWEFKHTIKYDTFKEVYEITLDERGGEVTRTKDFAEVKRIMSTAEDISLKPSWQLTRGTDYQIRIMAELKTVKLPFLLDYALFFLRFWDVETDWHVYNFSY